MGKQRRKKAKHAKKQPAHRPEPVPLLDPSLIKLLGISTLGYFFLWVVVGSLLGKGFVALIVTPLLALSLFVITKWDRSRTEQTEHSIKGIIASPLINYWVVLGVIAAIFIAHLGFTWLFVLYLSKVKTEEVLATEDLFDVLSLISDSNKLIVLTLIGLYTAHAIGGLVAGLLPNKRVPKPYRHAVTGSILYILLNLLIMAPFMSWGQDVELPSEQETGLIMLTTSPCIFLAMFGAWIGGGIRKSNSRTAGPSRENVGKIGLLFSLFKSQRALSIAIVSGACVILGAVIIWVARLPEPIICPDPPDVATLNYWPISYQAQPEPCHDFPPLDARIVSEFTEYSRSRAKWEEGLTTKAGDEIYILVYINNGAAANAKNINPGHGIARNVSLTTLIDTTPGSFHEVSVKFSGINTKTVESTFKLHTGPTDRLAIVPRSGEIINYSATEVMAKDLDVGNNSIQIGDVAPRWESAIFVRFRLRVH